MIEMLVAIAATFIMVLFLNQIFTSMSGGVALGVATSDVIQGSLMFNRQLRSDVEKMRVPGGTVRGVLIIVQKVFSGQKLRRDDDVSQATNVRSDQLIFIRDPIGIVPRSPASAITFQDATADSADAVRVWYGHVALTSEVGTSPNGLPGGPDNVPAANWVLGRQALFLDPTIDAGTNCYIDAYSGYPWDNVGYTAYLAPAKWYGSVSDIVNRGLGDFMDAIVHKDYPRFPQELYQIAGVYDRPWCNPRTLPGQAPVAWQAAQSYPYLLGNVSDFMVDFAGNYDPTQSPIDLVGSGDRIKWYDCYGSTLPALSFPLPPAYDPPKTTTPQVKLIWNQPNDLSGDPDPVFPTTQSADGVFIFGPGAGAGLKVWPHMVRIRYRLHDKNGKLAGEDGRPGKLFEHIIRIRDSLDAFAPLL